MQEKGRLNIYMYVYVCVYIYTHPGDSFLYHKFLSIPVMSIVELQGLSLHAVAWHLKTSSSPLDISHSV